MKLVYMGTPQFAVPPLLALHAAGHHIIGVVTRTDKPAGRGKVMTAPPVKLAAEKLGIPVYQPKRVREPEFIEILKKSAPEAIVVAAYGQILPKEILTLPPAGCINIHASLLPAYRGAAPINWAIIRGEQETGISIMLMDEGMDTGAVFKKERVLIDPNDTAGTLTEKLSLIGAKLIVEALPKIAAGELLPEQQNHTQATFAPLLKKEDGLIDWTKPAWEIHNRIRGLSPWPGAYTFLDNKMLKIINAEVTAGREAPGVLTVINKDVLAVGTADGLLRIVNIQPAGKKPMTASEFLRGHRQAAGKKLGPASNPRK